MKYFSAFIFFCVFNGLHSQVKFVVEDFEGFANGKKDLPANGIFTFGNAAATVENLTALIDPARLNYLGDRALTIDRSSGQGNSGWGKGMSLYVELDVLTDHINFFVKCDRKDTFRIILQEDDNEDSKYEEKEDDEWIYRYTYWPDDAKEEWRSVSLPLKDFKDENKGGDGIFNCNYQKGKLLCVLMSFAKSTVGKVSFDFISFSKGNLPLKKPVENSSCSFGLWSKESDPANFVAIGTEFEKLFGSGKKPAVIHFFQPFAYDGTTQQNNFPSLEKINAVIEAGYIPMITLENHFVNVDSKMKQPNLYSIVEGHMDKFFGKWAWQIKQVKGTVLVRVLHEFNGNWYPWCIVNNDKDPALFIKAFRHIRAIFKNENVTNVKFIWCPNSMSLPQEKWNDILDAYPGDEYVDCVGMDIYNGAGQGWQLWRSFRKEGIENYFLLTEHFASKPLLICEVASRERTAAEPTDAQTKEKWIAQMAEALESDMRKIILVSWFNEKSSFRISSSKSSEKAFKKYILENTYFTWGAASLKHFLK